MREYSEIIIDWCVFFNYNISQHYPDAVRKVEDELSVLCQENTYKLHSNVETTLHILQAKYDVSSKFHVNCDYNQISKALNSPKRQHSSPSGGRLQKYTIKMAGLYLFSIILHFYFYIS